jgi:hypothetical protein
MFADWDFNLRLSQETAVACVDRPLVGYYVHSNQMSSDFPRQEDDVSRMRKKYDTYPGLREVEWLWIERLCRVAMESGQFKSVIRLLLALIRSGHIPWWLPRRLLVQLAPKALSDWVRTRRLQDRLPVSWLEEAHNWLPATHLYRGSARAPDGRASDFREPTRWDTTP